MQKVNKLKVSTSGKNQQQKNKLVNNKKANKIKIMASNLEKNG